MRPENRKDFDGGFVLRSALRDCRDFATTGLLSWKENKSDIPTYILGIERSLQGGSVLVLESLRQEEMCVGGGY